MPLFRRSTFKTPRKPVRRRAESLPNLAHLDESILSMESMRLEAAPLTMRLGDCELSFEDGQWVMANDQGGGGRGTSSREVVRLQKQNHKLLEENNLLKYKIELLLDMLAASNADYFVMQKELETAKKSSSSSQTSKKR